MILKKLSVNADLSESSFKQACDEAYASVNNEVWLYVSTALIADALKLHKNVKVDDNLMSDHWYVKTSYFGVFSPGA